MLIFQGKHVDFFVEFIIYNNINLNNYNEKEWKLMIAIGLLIMLVLNIIYAVYNLKKGWMFGIQ